MNNPKKLTLGAYPVAPAAAAQASVINAQRGRIKRAITLGDRRIIEAAPKGRLGVGSQLAIAEARLALALDLKEEALRLEAVYVAALAEAMA